VLYFFQRLKFNLIFSFFLIKYLKLDLDHWKNYSTSSIVVYFWKVISAQQLWKNIFPLFLEKWYLHNFYTTHSYEVWSMWVGPTTWVSPYVSVLCKNYIRLCLKFIFPPLSLFSLLKKKKKKKILTSNLNPYVSVLSCMNDNPYFECTSAKSQSLYLSCYACHKSQQLIKYSRSLAYVYIHTSHASS